MVTKHFERDITAEQSENEKKPKDQQTKKIEKNSCMLTFQRCPLEKYAVVPDKLTGMKYSNVVAGAIRGALEVVLYLFESA